LLIFVINHLPLSVFKQTIKVSMFFETWNSLSRISSVTVSISLYLVINLKHVLRSNFGLKYVNGFKLPVTILNNIANKKNMLTIYLMCRFTLMLMTLGRVATSSPWRPGMLANDPPVASLESQRSVLRSGDCGIHIPILSNFVRNNLS